MIELFTLGRVDVRTASTPAAAAAGTSVRRLLLQPKALALFVYLGAHESFVRRDLLTALFWPELDERRARNSLSKTLRRVTDAAGSSVLETRGLLEIRVPAEQVWCDARELDRCAAAGAHSTALDLFRGEFLDGWHLAGLSEFSHWLETTRHRLRQAAVEAARRVAADRTALGDFDRAIEALRRARALAPASELVTRELMTLLDRRGDTAAALELFHEASSWLAREIGTRPSAPTRVLADALRAQVQTPVAQPPVPVSGAGPDPTNRMASALAVAVLPLENLTGDPTQRYFADGMTDALITQLARTGPGRVISRQSTVRYRESQLPAREIARELGVDLLLGGSIARAGERVRVTVHLVRTDPECHLWRGRTSARCTTFSICRPKSRMRLPQRWRERPGLYPPSLQNRRPGS